MTKENDKYYKISECICGSTNLKATNDPLFMPSIECQKCWRWSVGNTPEQAVERWNKAVKDWDKKNLED